MVNKANDKAVSGKATFTTKTLPVAIGNLFKMNNYEVEYNVHVHGAEIDIVARAKGDPFSLPVYIEATIEYVSTEKYGKDTTKFLLLNRKAPGSNLLCISAEGFTPSVAERARESGVTALSYDDLFAKFEKFSPYIDRVLSDKEIKKLIDAYEEPNFSDSKGSEPATHWLGYWRGYAPEEAKWLIILGEYGTGKTCLTRVMQYRWLQDYHNDPSKPIPVRIELRNFSRQFDAKGLLHHFLDHNGLGHVPVDFMIHLIRMGRVILLLDGYDEMAQFLNARERRACLGALAELAADGAKGIITSRPNYFTEAEELNVFEALYKSLEHNKYHISILDKAFVAEERLVDKLVENYVLNRYERKLQDLTPVQTESLVRRSLSNDVDGQKIVLSILNRVFREEDSGKKQALSGKPVIITYLLELIDELRSDASTLTIGALTEWQVYKFIVDRLMLRDLRRSALNPLERRKALQKLAVAISGRDAVIADEETFNLIIESEFQKELRRLPPDEKRVRKNELFEDLRSSATLTRADGSKEDGWNFSHNSLREFLSAELFLESLSSRLPIQITIPITFAMRAFVASLDSSNLKALWQVLAEIWPKRASGSELGSYVTLLWDAVQKSEGGAHAALRQLSKENEGAKINLAALQIKDIDFSEAFSGKNISFGFEESTISNCIFSGLDMKNSDFRNSVLDMASFVGANISECSFASCLLFECDLTDADIGGSDFIGIDGDSNIILSSPNGIFYSLSGKAAIGYLRYMGASTDYVDPIHVYRHHPKFPIIEKILEKISGQKNSQLLGLTQRGESRADPPFARSFVEHLIGKGWISLDRHELVSATPLGRSEIQRMLTKQQLPEDIVEFFDEVYR
ncbi:NACHT domain-containing protein [Azospirillum doebereinerae]|uniref:NACHT domain-containing protein n=1 Tax=Azospirillum doebereinerae TaxID=92933 RepID=UPI001EE59E4E|nr:NACHT domain-containing protein [Azospirillum doebereinerae]MCG5240465.1 NACHT domain-containing protein [Azospirillum doebereinerae]